MEEGRVEEREWGSRVERCGWESGVERGGGREVGDGVVMGAGGGVLGREEGK